MLRPEKLGVAYDKESDVLYISAGKPREADDSIEPQEGVVIRTRKRAGGNHDNRVKESPFVLEVWLSKQIRGFPRLCLCIRSVRHPPLSLN